MIRKLKDGIDKERAAEVVNEWGTAEEIGNMEEAITGSQPFLVYEQNGLKGLIFSIPDENGEETIFRINLFVDPASRLRGNGSKLYKEMEKEISKSNPDFVSVYINTEIDNPIPFAEKMGFSKWWGSPELIYKGGRFPEADVKFVKYTERFFEEFVKVVQHSFYELHAKNDLKPYLAPEDSVKKYKLNRKENVYLILDGDRIIASVTTGKGEVDNLMVSPEYQGKGYGRKALQFAMNKMLEEGYEEIRICYVEGNEGAEKLYTSMGFQPLHNTQVYRKFLK
ncbi:GNAT family N-acetyltransferase [Bacillus salacetis]|uniref:GNAT family N-acetyltransferase n=1 Tax=Bacillus salacetis TaxID=2315464 RepID=A0A3A1QV45_9BACI|nr:GNAT family N-acetyltransferase [Bacillus salacetis]RIW30410.1 GNAT family N-acetyltransferase [Bacillus salacetis]